MGHENSNEDVMKYAEPHDLIKKQIERLNYHLNDALGTLAEAEVGYKKAKDEVARLQRLLSDYQTLVT